MAKKTPLMNQYKEIKAKYQDAILFFRLGDFYEMFYDDAITASHELELTLTGKNTGEEKRAPMCGVPYHAAENYIYRLIQKGYRVAICEQLEDPKTARGLVKRGVIKVITPGTILYENAIADKSNNYLIYIHEEGRNLAAAMADVSTGECWWGLWDSRKEKGDFFDMLSVYSPAEAVLDVSDAFYGTMEHYVSACLGGCLLSRRREGDVGAVIPEEIEQTGSEAVATAYRGLSERSHEDIGRFLPRGYAASPG